MISNGNKNVAGRWRTLIRIVLLLVIFYLVLAGFMYWLGWHFEHPIAPAAK